MEYVIRAVWMVYAPTNQEKLSEIALDNISDASLLYCGDEDFFPKCNRDVYFWEDGNGDGFTIDCSIITEQRNDEDASKLADIGKRIFEKAGANINDMAISYERV